MKKFLEEFKAFALKGNMMDMILMPVWLSTGLMPSSVPMAGP